ncbi:putative reverse transcriptase domain-containing protein [Tanacetum coccineum]
MDKSWMRTSRTKKQYINGVEAFIKYAVHNLQKMRTIDLREHKVEEVQFHLFKYGIDLSYTKWDKHGEKDEQATTAQIPVNATTKFVDDMDFDMDFGSKIPTDGPATVEMVNATKESFDEADLAKFQELLLDAEKPLYKGCPDFTKLSAIVKLLNLKGKYGASDKFFTELLGLLKKMLPAGNEMVEKTYQAKKLMRMMGSGYKKIHAWHTIDEKFPKFAKDLRNLRLGISADGVDVNLGTRHHKPLVDDLHTLFEIGVDTYDASTKENFNLRTVVLWTINDYLALGTLCGCPYSRFKGCVRLNDDLIFDTTADPGGEEVVVKPAETSVSAVAKELTNNDMTMAKALAELKTSKPKVVTTVPILNSATTVTTTKPKAKGITIHEHLVTQKTTVSFISSSKGKAIKIESKKPVKIKDLSAHDEQVAKDLHDKIQVELEEEAKRQEEASMAALAELYEAIQAHIDADQELAARMTIKEHEKYTVKERARMLAEFIKNRKKQFTHAQLKHIDFEEIRGLYNKEKELVDTFVPIRSEEDVRRIKDQNTKAEEESSNKDVDSTNKRKKRIRMKRSSKKQKTDADLKEEEQLKTFLSIVPNEEEAIDYEVLDKRYQIVHWKFEFYHNDRYGEPHDSYRVFRADGSSRYIKTFIEMVSRKYPLTKETLEKMLVLRLTAESESEAAFDLLRLVLLVEDFAAAEVLKNLLQVVSAVRVNINIVFVPSMKCVMEMIPMLIAHVLETRMRLWTHDHNGVRRYNFDPTIFNMVYVSLDGVGIEMRFYEVSGQQADSFPALMYL